MPRPWFCIFEIALRTARESTLSIAAAVVCIGVGDGVNP